MKNDYKHYTIWIISCMILVTCGTEAIPFNKEGEVPTYTLKDVGIVDPSSCAYKIMAPSVNFPPPQDIAYVDSTYDAIWNYSDFFYFEHRYPPGYLTPEQLEYFYNIDGDNYIKHIRNQQEFKEVYSTSKIRPNPCIEEVNEPFIDFNQYDILALYFYPPSIRGHCFNTRYKMYKQKVWIEDNQLHVELGISHSYDPKQTEDVACLGNFNKIYNRILFIPKMSDDIDVHRHYVSLKAYMSPYRSKN